MTYIPIDKDKIPYRFDIQLEDVPFTFEVHYNSEFDYFTIDLYQESNLIVYGEKIVYGKPLFITCLHLPIPPVLIVPLDLAEIENEVTYENLNDKVFLYILGDDHNE